MLRPFFASVQRKRKALKDTATGLGVPPPFSLKALTAMLRPFLLHNEREGVQLEYWVTRLCVYTFLELNLVGG